MRVLSSVAVGVMQLRLRLESSEDRLQPGPHCVTGSLSLPSNRRLGTEHFLFLQADGLFVGAPDREGDYQDQHQHQEEQRHELGGWPLRTWTMIGAISNEIRLMTFNSGLSAGPLVSFSGSPTVSPTTAALCGSEPLPP